MGPKIAKVRMLITTSLVYFDIHNTYLLTIVAILSKFANIRAILRQRFGSRVADSDETDPDPDAIF